MDPVIPWYLSFSGGEASPSSRWESGIDSFIGVVDGVGFVEMESLQHFFDVGRLRQFDGSLLSIPIYSQS